MADDLQRTPATDVVWLPVPRHLGRRVFPRLGGRKRADVWALVLEAKSIPYRLTWDETGRNVVVPEQWLDRAQEELRLFEEENRNWPPQPPPVRAQQENTLSTLSILLLFAIFHNLTRIGVSLPGEGPVDWVEFGRARAADIVNHGEWWRAVTALTLHAGVVHLCSNLLIGGVIMVLLCREIGSGLAWSLVLGSGVIGNLINAYAQLPTHASIGASTGLFGAVGILSAISLMRYRNLPRRWLLPVAAGLALLASLGTEGQNTDLGAHFFGFLAGVALGVGGELAVLRWGRPRRGYNALLAWSAALVVVGAWWLAIRAGLAG